MIHPPRPLSVAALILLAPLLALAAPAAKGARAKPSLNDYPTQDRVLYVQECMRTNPGPNFEMISKCSCALDRLAEEVSFTDYVEMSTVVNAVTIGGERGGELRDNETLKPKMARWRQVQAKAQAACFIGGPPK